MCGIAGYSLSPDSSVKRTLAAQALLAGIAERGADAVGYAHRGASAAVTVHKRRSGASELLGRAPRPSASTQVLVHVRDYTKGHPTIEANNHPIRHGSVVGIHNGIIVNDEEIFARLRLRARPSGHDGRLGGDLRPRRARRGQPEGARGAARRDGDRLARRALRLRRSSLPARVGRPLWLGTAGKELFFASTRARSTWSSRRSG